MASDGGTTGGHEPIDAEASPWPVLVALGVALSEIGGLFGIRPVPVGGLLLLVGTIAAILHESGYVARPVGGVGVQGTLLVVVGLSLVAAAGSGSTTRGQSIAIAGAISLLAVPAWIAVSRTRPGERLIRE